MLLYMHIIIVYSCIALVHDYSLFATRSTAERERTFCMISLSLALMALPTHSSLAYCALSAASSVSVIGSPRGIGGAEDLSR